MDNESVDEVDESLEPRTTKITTTISIGDTDSSLSLSLTPPSLDEGEKKDKNDDKSGLSEESEDSISEHLSSIGTSIENDRSLQEIQIDNFSFSVQENPEENQRLSQELKPSLINSQNDSESVISLNALDTFGLLNMEHGEIKSILEEILNNEQFISESNTSRNSKDSFDIFADLDLEDKSLTERIISKEIEENQKFFDTSNVENTIKQVKDLEELLEIKDQTIHALTSELDSLREIVSNPSTLSMGTSTQYMQFQDEYQNKIVEFNNAIEQKDDLILQLTESLQQSIQNREELKTQVDMFKNELEYLQNQLENTTKILISKENRSGTPEIMEEEKTVLQELQDTEFEVECLKLQETLSFDQKAMLNSIKNIVRNYIDNKLIEEKNENQEVLTNLRNTIEEEREKHIKEIKKLKETLEKLKSVPSQTTDLRHELEEKHQKEMEDLRRYFEQKCADLEKSCKEKFTQSFSDEILSHHSRKRSGSCTSSDNDLLPEIRSPFKPGPGGDAPSSMETYKINYKNRALQNLTRNDLINLKRDLENILAVFNEYNIENAPEKELVKLRDELGNYDIRNLFKIEIEAFKNEMKNKYNAELEILNQDYENRVDRLRVQQEEKMLLLKDKYMEEIENLKEILNKTNKSLQYSTAVQEVGSSGEFEINEVVQSYERRLQEQVNLAKIDIIAALENQIQILAANEGNDEEWPQELLILRQRFEEKYQLKIEEIQEKHDEELAKLKEEHLRSLNGALERARRRSLREDDVDIKIVERDNYKKQAGLLRNLLRELLKYFTQCEDEVNNTIVDELLRHATEKNLTDIERELNDSTTSTKSSTSTPSIRRVHLAPNFKELLNILENSDTESPYLSMDLKNELESCLDKLRTEANAVLALSLNVSKKSDDKDIFNDELKLKMIEEIDQQRKIIDSLEKERTILENQIVELIERLNVTQNDFEKAQLKISDLLESGQREIVSEGYGGGAFAGGQEGRAIATFNALQEKARTIIVGSRSHDPNLLHLLEDLVTVGERIIEESRNEKKDLEQQIDVADKKLRQTCKFLEEQAADREMERDESQKQILALEEQLKNMDKNRATFANISDEVENLEIQLKELTKRHEDKERKLKEIEVEKDEAIEKIFFLRDVIRELETQVKLKTDAESELRTLVAELEKIISELNKRKIEENFEANSDDDREKLREHIRSLEGEVQKLRLGQELVGTEGALRELRNQLVDVENIIDKKTKELEEHSSIVSTTACSSPSEDMSVRDVVRPKTPSSLTINDCEIPLQQLARLKEKLIRHARAEDAALKRIRDLEMQVFNLKAAIEEYQTERDILKKEISDQLVLISSLQIRLDDQRIRAEHIEKQTNSSLESRIYDLQKEISDLQEHLQNRNIQIAHLNGLIEEMKVKMEEKDGEISEISEDEMIVTMQKEIEHLRNQNELLHKRLNSGVDIIPNLVENIISDKNSDIESLKQKLETTEKQLELYNSLNLDKSQILALKNLQNSGTSLCEVISIIELSDPEQVRRMADSSADFENPRKIHKRKDDTVFLDDVKEISSIEKLGGNFHNFTPSGKKNSTEIRSADRRVHFNVATNVNNETELENMLAELEKLKTELKEKDKIIKDCSDKLKTLNQLETNIDFVQKKLDETQNTLKNVTEKFENEITKKDDSEKELRVELVQKKVYLEERDKEIQFLKEDSQRKDDMYLKLSKDMKNIKKEKEILEEKLEQYKEIEDIMSVKNKIILELEEQLAELRNKDVNESLYLENKIKINEQECESLKLRLDSYSKESSEKDNIIQTLEKDNKKLTEIIKIETENAEKLRKNLLNKEKQIEENEITLNRLKRQVGILENEKFLLDDEIKLQNNKIIEQENELRKTKENLENNTVKQLEKHISELQDENSLKIIEIDNLRSRLKNLNDELGRMQDVIGEKDKIIALFKNDSEMLQKNLETIQNKMQESGNIVDLTRKLRDEQMKNSELLAEIQILKAQIMSYKFLEKDAMVASIDEITGKMRQELDYSAQIDENIITATEDAEELHETLSKLKTKYNDLHAKFAQTQELNKKLQDQLTSKQLEFETVQIEDAHLMEQLRIQLENASENETELENLTEKLKKRCDVLEIEISKLKTQLSNANSRSESTEYKSLPTKESMEITRFKNEILELNKELGKCKDEVKNLKKIKKELETNLRYSKDMCELKNREINNLEMKIEENSKKEIELMEKLRNANEQLDKKNKEVENSRVLMDEMGEEMADMKKRIEQLNNNLKNSKEKRAPHLNVPNTSLPIADQIMNKIEEINSTVKDDRKTMDLILRLTNDNKMLKNRIFELESEGTVNVPFENPMNRANYLFAKCLRVESYRKSLIWQKKYLISLLGSYQKTTDLGPLEKFQGAQKKLKFTGIQRFRCVAYVIIATLRMKFIVRRWHTGARLAENVNLRYRNANPDGIQSTSHIQSYPGRSRNDLENVLNSDSRLNTGPWSGSTPPCREKSTRTRLSPNLAILKAPQLLNQYAERYNKIQEHLELLLNSDQAT